MGHCSSTIHRCSLFALSGPGGVRVRVFTLSWYRLPLGAPPFLVFPRSRFLSLSIPLPVLPPVTSRNSSPYNHYSGLHPLLHHTASSHLPGKRKTTCAVYAMFRACHGVAWVPQAGHPPFAYSRPKAISCSRLTALSGPAWRSPEFCSASYPGTLAQADQSRRQALTHTSNPRVRPGSRRLLDGTCLDACFTSPCLYVSMIVEALVVEES
ncbi:hypothetical protein JB92DRAFT_2880150 [Gautieria morchelliformis]|nr:hypothetical protein JB92DRAFT_2880150 [Gautieria morchelliformis]